MTRSTEVQVRRRPKELEAHQGGRMEELPSNEQKITSNTLPTPTITRVTLVTFFQRTLAYIPPPPH